jgi:hyaluronoglucosaminidase
MVVTPNGRTRYVINARIGTRYGGNSVTPIGIATNRAGRQNTVGHQPEIISVTSNGKMVYVLNLRSMSPTPISFATNKPGRAIQLHHYPVAMVIVG